MLKQKDGGPAFPTDEAFQTTGGKLHYEGMSIRDYFAGQALAGFVSNPSTAVFPREGQSEESALAESCYVLANAMIKEGNDK